MQLHRCDVSLYHQAIALRAEPDPQRCGQRQAQQRKDEALGELRRAAELDPANARFRYVYDVARAEIER